MPGITVERNLRQAPSVGPFRIVSMNSESDFSVKSPQYAFLAAELASIDRVATPWVGHGGCCSQRHPSHWGEGGSPGCRASSPVYTPKHLSLSLMRGPGR